jgi:hypothetical protein
MIKRTAVMAVVGMLALGSVAWADEGKDESGKGKERWRQDSRDGKDRDKRERSGGQGTYFEQHGRSRIPDGHLPPPGECRIWYPDRPAGQQPPPFKCGQGRPRVEPGGWLMTPGPQPEHVDVAVYDPRRPGVVIGVAIFDARTGSMIRIGATK